MSVEYWFSCDLSKLSVDALRQAILEIDKAEMEEDGWDVDLYEFRQDVVAILIVQEKQLLEINF